MTEAEILAMPAGREMDRLIDQTIFGRAPGVGCPWNYSEAMGSAWAVVEKLTSRPTKTMFYLEYSGRWRAGFQPIWTSVASGETAPLAICRAALIETQRMAEAI